MKASNSLWKENLAGKLPEELAQEVDILRNGVGPEETGEA